MLSLLQFFHLSVRLLSMSFQIYPSRFLSCTRTMETNTLTLEVGLKKKWSLWLLKANQSTFHIRIHPNSRVLEWYIHWCSLMKFAHSHILAKLALFNVTYSKISSSSFLGLQYWGIFYNSHLMVLVLGTRAMLSQLLQVGPSSFFLQLNLPFWSVCQ